jgi:hypothetical protein
VDLSPDDWWNLGTILCRSRSQLRWAFADWWAYADHRYGDRRQLVDGPDWNGPSYQTCMHMGTVARAFETCRRRQDLSFTHHAEVAGLPPAEADALLQWCIDEGEPDRPRSVADLREEIRRRGAEKVVGFVVPLKIEASDPEPIEIAVQVTAASTEPVEFVVPRAPLPSAATTQEPGNVVELPPAGTKAPPAALPAAFGFAADISTIGDAIAAALDVINLPGWVCAKLENAQAALARLRCRRRG